MLSGGKLLLRAFTDRDWAGRNPPNAKEWGSVIERPGATHRRM
jgi:hypothetical protein